MTEEMNIQIRDTQIYDEIINNIGKLLVKHNCSYVEAYGILECVKNHLQEEELEGKK